MADPPKIRLFVLGRHFAHFSGDTEPDVRAAWGMWPQVLRLCVEERDPVDPIKGHFQALKAQSPFMREPSIPRGQDMQIGDLKIVHVPGAAVHTDGGKT